MSTNGSIAWHSDARIVGEALSQDIFIPREFTPMVQATANGALQVSIMYLNKREAQAAIDGLRLAAMQIEHAERRRERLAAILREGLTPCDARDNGHE